MPQIDKESNDYQYDSERNRVALCQAYFTAFLRRIQVPGKDFVVLVEVLHYTKVRYVEKNCFSGR